MSNIQKDKKPYTNQDPDYEDELAQSYGHPYNTSAPYPSGSQPSYGYQSYGAASGPYYPSQAGASQIHGSLSQHHGQMIPPNWSAISPYSGQLYPNVPASYGQQIGLPVAGQEAQREELDRLVALAHTQDPRSPISHAEIQAKYEQKKRDATAEIGSILASKGIVERSAPNRTLAFIKLYKEVDAENEELKAELKRLKEELGRYER